MIKKEAEFHYAPRIYKRMPWKVRKALEETEGCVVATRNCGQLDDVDPVLPCSLELEASAGMVRCEDLLCASSSAMKRNNRNNTTDCTGSHSSETNGNRVILNKPFDNNSPIRCKSQNADDPSFTGVSSLTAGGSSPPPLPLPELHTGRAEVQPLSFTERVKCTVPLLPGMPLSDTHILRVAKFFFDPHELRWQAGSTILRVHRPCPPLGVGGMRACFLVEEVTHCANNKLISIQMVGKRFLRRHYSSRSQFYYRESEMQNICNVISLFFNQAVRNMCPVREVPEVPRQNDSSFPAISFSFVPSVVIRVSADGIPPPPYTNESWGTLFSTKSVNSPRCPPNGRFKEKANVHSKIYRPPSYPVWFSMEPLLRGGFTKYNSNCGGVYASSTREHLTFSETTRRLDIFEAAEAFSHFTLADSGGQLLVCDLQGVGTCLTDPQIHTVHGHGFGLGNMGQEGIWKWVMKHKCNRFCRALQLPALRKCSLTDARQQMTETTFFDTPIPQSRNVYNRIQAFCSRHGSLGTLISNPWMSQSLDQKDSIHDAPAPWRLNTADQCNPALLVSLNALDKSNLSTTVSIPKCYTVG